MPVVRRAEQQDLESIARIQQAAPEAAQWTPADYLAYDTWVAICENRVAGFLCARALGDTSEWEILNLAVAPEWRRCGLARSLLRELLARTDCYIFLEV